jgi:hypothetical protein
MLDEAVLAIGPVPMVIGILLLLVAAYRHQLPPPKSVKTERLGPHSGILQLPQSIPSNIPYIGHVLGYVQNGHGYFSSLW